MDNSSSSSSSISSGAGMNTHVQYYTYGTIMICMLRYSSGITSTVAIVFLVNDTNTNADTDLIVGIYHSILNKFGSDLRCGYGEFVRISNLRDDKEEEVQV